MADEALARRMFLALNALERTVGEKVTLAGLGELAASEERRGAPYAAPVVRRWLKGEQDPGSRGQWIALARALRVDPGWLAFGEASQAPGIVDPAPPRVNGVTAPVAPGRAIPVSSRGAKGGGKKQA